MNMIRMTRGWLVLNSLRCATVVALLASVMTSRAAVIETSVEFLANGDFNGDGLQDIAIVDRATGRVRLGYRVSTEFFNWADWRSSGVKSVTGVSVGRLVDAKRDSLAIVSADGNQIGVLDAPDPKVMTEPVAVPCEVLGPNTVVAVDVGGAGNTPLHDLYVASIYNTDPENHVTLFRADGKTFTQTADLPAKNPASHGNRVKLKNGGAELAATLTGSGDEAVWQAENLASGKPEEVASLSGVPAAANYFVANFDGKPAKEIVFFKSEEATFSVSTLEEAGGKFKPTALQKIALPQPARQLLVADNEGKSRLIAIFGTNEPAQLLDFDGAKPPVLVQTLAGTTNKVLNSGIALPDAIVLFSSLMPGRAATHYQVHILKEGKFVPAAYGALATLDDRDDSTVPAIRERILVNSPEKSPADMKAYTNTIPGTEVTYAMTAIPGGEFVMGSPDSEADRKDDEGPQHKVKISPFWMGTYEVTWDQYLLFIYPDDEKKLRETHPTDAALNQISDAVTRPSKPYVDMSFGMGKAGFPAIAMTQHGANKFCHWLSAKTGHFYRLPTEAEWEYACRAGTTTAYSFGTDAGKLGEYGWFFDNSNSKYQKVGKKKPNPWGLYDMHGNVTEWVLDQYAPDFYKLQAAAGTVTDPWNKATMPYPHSARGGSWDDDAVALRSAARRGSDRSWKMTDPQLPKGKWYHTDAQFIGFRIVRPLTVPTAEEMTKYWISGVEKD
jgi:formylglycine-generating enzyme required for sulfatase activity